MADKKQRPQYALPWYKRTVISSDEKLWIEMESDEDKDELFVRFLSIGDASITTTFNFNDRTVLIKVYLLIYEQPDAFTNIMIQKIEKDTKNALLKKFFAQKPKTSHTAELPNEDVYMSWAGKTAEC